MVVRVLKYKKPISTILLMFVLMYFANPFMANAAISQVGNLPLGLTYSNSALGSDGCIYLFGGYPTPLEVIKFNPADQTALLSGVEMPYFTSGASSVSAQNGKIYMFGGGGSTYHNDIVEFDPNNGVITNLSVKMPVGRRYACASIGGNGKIYVFGGENFSNRYLNDIIEFDPSSYTVKNLAVTLPTGRREACASVGNNGKIYIFGGRDASSVISDILEFDPNSYALNKLSDTLPAPRSYSCSVTDNTGKIYIIGGRNVNGMKYDDIIQFDSSSKSLGILSDKLPQAISKATACVANDGKIYIFGGEDINPLSSILSFDPSVISFNLDAPTLNGRLANGKDIVLTWNNVLESTSYIVERSTDGINFTEITEVTSATYNDISIPPGTYYYQVRAKNNLGQSDPSNMVTLTFKEPPAPAAPQLTGTLKNYDGVLNWTTVVGATNYILYKSSDGVNYNQIFSGPGRTYTDQDLSAGSYNYYVKAQTSDSISLKSNVVNLKIMLPPLPVGTVFWIEGGQYVHIDWSSQNPPTSSTVYLFRKDSINGNWYAIKEMSIESYKKMSWDDTNVTEGINYAYQMRAYNSTTWDWDIIADLGWATNPRPYPAPSGLEILSTTESTATIVWKQIQDATSYQYQTSIDGGNTWSGSTAISSNSITVTRPCMFRVKAGTHARSQWSGILNVN